MGNSSLPKYEVVLYFSVWVVAFGYMAYSVYLAGKSLEPSLGDRLGKSLYGFKKDISYYIKQQEYKFTYFTLSKWLAAHIVLAQLTRWFSPKYIPAVHFLTTVSMLCVQLSPQTAALLVVHAAFFFLILQFKSVYKTWVWGMGCTIMFNRALGYFWVHEEDNRYLFSLAKMGLMWQHMKCISFVIDHIKSDNKTRKTRIETLNDFVGYCFYLPNFFHGPIILYSDFGPYLYQPFERFTWQRIGPFISDLRRILFWAVIEQGLLHVFYIFALRGNLHKVAQLGYWTYGGLGVLHAVFFLISLLVTYGFGFTIARFDGYNPPPLPKCVFCQSLISDVWRIIDIGFYQHIKKYVYEPLCAGSRDLSQRLFASFCCFSFMFFWHGTQHHITIWALYNWLEASVTAIVRDFAKTEDYKNWERRTLSENNSRRVAALLRAPISLITCTIATFFLSGVYAGNSYFREIFFKSSWTALGIMLFIFYCHCQVSFETQSWKRKKETEKKCD